MEKAASIIGRAGDHLSEIARETGEPRIPASGEPLRGHKCRRPVSVVVCLRAMKRPMSGSEGRRRVYLDRGAGRSHSGRDRGVGEKTILHGEREMTDIRPRPWLWLLAALLLAGSGWGRARADLSPANEIPDLQQALSSALEDTASAEAKQASGRRLADAVVHYGFSFILPESHRLIDQNMKRLEPYFIDSQSARSGVLSVAGV